MPVTRKPDEALEVSWEIPTVRGNLKGIDMTTDRASYPGVPDDFPVSAITSAIGGAHPKNEPC